MNLFDVETWKSVDVPEVYAKYKHMNSESHNSWEELKEDKIKKKVFQAKVKINTELVEMVNKEILVKYKLYDKIKGWFETIRSFV